MSDAQPAIDLPGIRQFRMDGHVALVTGGSKGLGTAIAAGLASAGASLVIAARGIDDAKLVAEQIASQYSVKTLAVGLDVTDPSSVEHAVAQVLTTFGRMDVLINSAGINIRGSIESLTYEQFQAVQKTNVDGTWLCCKSVVPHMKAAGYGRIVNIASTLGIVGLANRTPYTASKGAIVTMTRALGLELAKTGVTCNALCPGPFLTPMNIPIADSEEAKRNIIGATAMERWGSLSEIQGAALLLASPASSYMTGSMITVDGGWTAR